MGTFTYRAINSVGKTINGTIESESQQSVYITLKKKGLHPLEVTASKNLDINFDFLNKWQRASSKDILSFITQLSTMVKSGMSLIICLDVIISQTTKKNLKKVYSEIKNEVAKGRNLSEVILKYPRVFPSIFSNIIKAGEESGKLDLVLDRYAEFLKKKGKIESEIKSALIYPVILVLLSIGVIIFLTTFIVPKFADLIQSSGTEFPGSMKMLLAASGFIRENYPLIIISLIIFVGIVIKYLKSEKGSYQFDVIKLKIPILGPLLYKTIISRFIKTMSTLLASGVPFLKNLKLAINVLNNKMMVKKMSSTFDNISKGEKISKQFEKTRLFSPMVIQMITIGENSGALDKMFDEIATMYDNELEAAIKRLTSALEPLVLIFVASIIGFIAVSLVSSVLKAVNSFK